jgi:hypothetical protein
LLLLALLLCPLLLLLLLLWGQSWVCTLRLLLDRAPVWDSITFKM